MAVVSNYKETEAGVIPDEWGVSPLARVASLERGKFSARPRNDPKYYCGATPFIQTGDVAKAHGDITTFSQTLNAEGVKVSKVFPRGTVFFTIAAIIGDVGIATFDTACPDSLVAVRPLPGIDTRWLFYELQSRKRSFEALATQNAQLNINLEKLRPYLVPVPPVSEQRAIAAALADCDAFLASIERLIAKKRDLGDAIARELLTGQIRLPGFQGDWEVTTLGAVATVSKGTQLHSSEANLSGNFAHLNGGIGPSGYTHKSNTPGNTIAISEGGNSCGYVQFMVEPYWCGGHCYSVIPNGIANRFLYHALKGQQSGVMGLRVGSGLPNVQKTALLRFQLRYPATKTEQTAIAEVLSNMDEEIDALEARREKTRALRQGMMQELLTGRTRLL